MKKKPRFGSISKLRSLTLDEMVLTEVGAIALSHFRQILTHLSFEMFEDRDGQDCWELLEPFVALKRIDVECPIDASENFFAFLRSRRSIVRINMPIIFSTRSLLLSALNSSTFHNLTSLILDINVWNSLVGLNFYGLLALKNLTDLTVMCRYCEIPFLSDVLGIGAMTQLTSLNISDNCIANVVPISKLTNLHAMRFQILAFRPAGLLDPLSNLVRLKRLNITYIDESENGDAGVPVDVSSFNFLKSLEQLVVLSIRCSPPTPIIPIMTLLSESCPNLESFTYRDRFEDARDLNICSCKTNMTGKTDEWKSDFVPGFGSLRILDIDTNIAHPKFMRLTSVAHSLEIVRIIPGKMRDLMDLVDWESDAWVRGGKICEFCQNLRAILCDFYSDKDRFPHMKNCRII